MVFVLLLLLLLNTAWTEHFDALLGRVDFGDDDDDAVVAFFPGAGKKRGRQQKREGEEDMLK